MNDLFRKFAGFTSSLVGSPWTFAGAFLIVIVWLITGPLFNYSTAWQLAINTFTTITTFLIVFLIQNTQNRDSKAIHLKLDELIRSIKNAKNQFLDIEHVSDEELENLHTHFQELHEKYQKELNKRKSQN